MIINNFIEFEQLIQALQLQNTEDFYNYFNGYKSVCSCKPVLKQLYHNKCNKSYIRYLSNNQDHIRSKLLVNNKDSIYKFCTSESKEILTINI